MSAETVQAVTQIEWVVAPEETPLPPLPIRIAMNATNGGKIGLDHLHIANPYTSEHIQVTTMPDFNGEQILEVIAPNGTSYWKMNGEHICGFHPEGTITESTDWVQSQTNAFMNPIWAGVR